MVAGAISLPIWVLLWIVRRATRIIRQEWYGMPPQPPALCFAKKCAAIASKVGRDCLTPQLLELTVFGAILLAPSVTAPTSRGWEV